MRVRLISYTKPAWEKVEIIDFMDEERILHHDDALTVEEMSPKDLIAFCARVSNPTNQMNRETSDRLIKYLMRHKHWSPFEMVNVCMEIESTRDIIRQILRHRSFHFQEFSQRYADPTEHLGFELREARLQDPKNRQNSIELNTEGEDVTLIQEWYARQGKVIDAAREAYNWAIENGIAKEVARAVMPEGNTESRIYMNGTVRSWLHYIMVRTDPSTQKEHREIAAACAKVLEKLDFTVETEEHNMVQGG